MELVARRYAVRLNGMTALAITKLDVLSGIDPLRVAVRYRSREGAIFDRFPYHQSILHSAEAEYKELPGFGPEIGACRGEADLPPQARAYLDFIADFLGVPIALVGVGPGRDQRVNCHGTRIGDSAQCRGRAPGGSTQRARDQQRWMRADGGGDQHGRLP